MKTIISIAIAFVFLLSACGQGTKTNKAEAETKAEPKTEVTAEAEMNTAREELGTESADEAMVKRQEGNSAPEPKAAPHPDAKMPVPAVQDLSKGGLLGPKKFAQILAENPDAQIIDVRTPNEVKQGRLAHSVNINVFDPQFMEKIGKLDKTKPLFIYCAVGGRSGRAAKMVQGLGFAKVFDMRGGITQWKAQGLEVIK